MNEASKNKWIAVVTAIVIVAFFFGGIIFYSFNNNVSSQLDGAIESEPVDYASTSTEADIITTTMTTTTSPEGLIIEEKRIGAGEEAKAGQTVSVNYTGTLENGTKFDSSYDRGQPITFTLGVGQVIKGWDQGIAGMKVGGARHLVIPAALAYGDRAVGGVIPANSTLVFDVELVAIQ